MNENKVFNILLVISGLALSLFLSLEGWAIYTNYGIRTPGILAADALVPPGSAGHELDRLSEKFTIEGIVDWILWFAMMWVIYFLFTKIWRKLKG